MSKMTCRHAFEKGGHIACNKLYPRHKDCGDTYRRCCNHCPRVLSCSLTLLRYKEALYLAMADMEVKV